MYQSLVILLLVLTKGYDEVAFGCRNAWKSVSVLFLHFVVPLTLSVLAKHTVDVAKRVNRCE